MKKFRIVLAVMCAILFIAPNVMAGSQASAVAGATAGADYSGNQSVVINNPGTDLSKGRGFAIPGETLFPGTPGYYGEATPGHRFIPLSKLLMFNTVWDVAKAKNMLAGNTGKKDIQIRDLLASDDTIEVNKVYCSILKPAQLGATATEQASIGTIAATNRKSISADVLAAAIVNAADRDSNYIMFMAEGVNREVDANGVGIGFNTTQAQIYSGENNKSNVSSGGFGWSRGWAGYLDYPWLQFTYLRVEGIDGLPIVSPPPAEPMTTSAAADTTPVRLKEYEQGETSGVKTD